MSCRLTALPVVLLVLRVQSIDSKHTQSLPFPLDFEFPQIDGSAVEDTCRIFSPAKKAPPPITIKQVEATTKRPAVQKPPKTPETKDTGTLIVPQPVPARPITNSQSDLTALLLAYLLTNSRRHEANSMSIFFSQPIGLMPNRGYGRTSDSNELAATRLKNTNRNRWKVGRFSSEDSSDES